MVLGWPLQWCWDGLCNGVGMAFSMERTFRNRLVHIATATIHVYSPESTVLALDWQYKPIQFVLFVR